MIPALDTDITDHAMGALPWKIGKAANVTRQRLTEV